MKLLFCVILLPFTIAAPIKRGLLNGILAIPPILTQIDVPGMNNEIQAAVNAITERGGAFDGTSLLALGVQQYVPTASILEQTVGVPNLEALDILADRLCIAGRQEGSICNELLAYAYAWYVAQQQGYTYGQVAALMGVSIPFFGRDRDAFLTSISAK